MYVHTYMQSRALEFTSANISQAHLYTKLDQVMLITQQKFVSECNITSDGTVDRYFKIVELYNW